MTGQRRPFIADTSTENPDDLLYAARRYGLRELALEVEWHGNDLTRKRVRVRYRLPAGDPAEVEATSVRAALRGVVRAARRSHAVRTGHRALVTRQTRRPRTCAECSGAIPVGDRYVRRIRPPVPGGRGWGETLAVCVPCSLARLEADDRTE